MILGCLSQKGRTGKSTIARLVAQQFLTVDGMTVHIADMDPAQGTSVKWAAKRRKAGLGDISCAAYKDVPSALEAGRNHRLLIFDGPRGRADSRHRLRL